MRFTLLLVLVLCALAPAASAQDTLPTIDQAVQMADAGDDAGALAALRQRAAANPDDRETRLWIARLHERMGHPDLAEPVYRSVLLEDPTSLDAMIGVASTLLARQEADEAIEILEVAESRAPRNVTTFVLLGRAHRLAGRSARAIEYFQRAAAMEPTSEHRLRLERARLAHQHWFETRGFGEQFNGGTPDSRSGEVRVNYRLRETLRVSGRGQVQRKFGVSEERGGGGVEWRWRPDVALHGQVLVGRGNLVMPEGDYLGEIAYTYQAATWSAAVRYFDFTGAKTTLVTPAVSWLASERLTVDLRYAMSWSESNTLLNGEAGHSMQLRGDYRLYPRLSIQAGYSGGIEDFETFSIDRTGDFRANTAMGGLRLHLPTLTSIAGGYERQWREQGISMGRVTVALQQRF